jgi:4a-hydroxytetrahydrobiopterin dehydratase
VSRPERLDDATVAGWLEGHPAWRLDHDRLVRELRTRDYPSSIAILDAQVTLAEGLDHHPVVTVGYRELRFELWTHDRGGITQLDLDYINGLDELLVARFAQVLAD